MDILIKRPDEGRLYDMDFSKSGVLRAGDTINGVEYLSSTPTGLTFGTPTISASGQVIQFKISDGQDGLDYLVSVQISTVGGDRVNGEGRLLVRVAS